MTLHFPKPYPKIPITLVWAQCIAFSMLYGVWMIYELLNFRRILLISGAVLALYPIYQYRSYFFQKKALPIWLIVVLFIWSLLHLFFLAHDYPAQLLELRRIWKYAGLGAIFAFGLGLSLFSVSVNVANPRKKNFYWVIIYFGLCTPVLIYLFKYVATIYMPILGITPPDFLKISSNAYLAHYIPKTNYIAFCLPTLAVSLGQIYSVLSLKSRLRIKQYLSICLYSLIVCAVLMIFYLQDTKNGIAYAIICIAIFLVLLMRNMPSIKFWRKLLLLGVVIFAASFLTYLHTQKNESWKTLMADTRIALQTDRYQQWRFPGEQELPRNEYGSIVSGTNYARAAWFKVGIQLAIENPLGYGLVEDSFKNMVKARWQEVGNYMSHSHSGWLDLILAMGFPGFILIFSALIMLISQTLGRVEPWGILIFWGGIANVLLWITTEVSATVTFAALIFWVCWGAGLTMLPNKSH